MGDERTKRCVLLDGGNTLMRDSPDYMGPMYTWPRLEALPHVHETLAVLQPGWMLAVATNAADSDESDIRKALARLDLDVYIDRVYCAKTIGHRKPSPGFFGFILQDLGLPPENVVMVGDSFNADVLGAVRSGIRAVWFNELTDETRAGDLYRTTHDFKELFGVLQDLGIG
jgi:HAD superfamily hydrolase (TIGR01662 family)